MSDRKSSNTRNASLKAFSNAPCVNSPYRMDIVSVGLAFG